MSTPIDWIRGSVASPAQLYSVTDQSNLQLCQYNDCRIVNWQLSSSYNLL
ncbi:hypothetical protein PDIG_11080 [Penicillium digitatum PHI26]|uniref:Uncharacterized protein n=2 Tax=Penicillium digitatum TaxID=36651 RepID=K9G888_PEND2|nr:hypothetical protein PDIP_82590 [Penicillium digitatum Pd1]EKV05579.1 hypothetical protein PDIP_82590 [Penicillium digitatum Pd1]EKV18160.1 hypothetical protein PDIG_11080 [Penicillium digitatum PHI26]